VLSREGAKLRVFLDLRERHGLLRGPEELVIIDEHTIERPWGWVFFYTTRGWIDGDWEYAIAGNAPYMVGRNGSVQHAGTARPIEEYIRDYESELERRSGAWELFIAEKSDCPLAVASGIRSALALSVNELGALRRRLPVVIASGAAVDLEPACSRLVAAGVRAVVRRSGHQIPINTTDS
jgi:Immunity protein 35